MNLAAQLNEPAPEPKKIVEKKPLKVKVKKGSKSQRSAKDLEARRALEEQVAFRTQVVANLETKYALDVKRAGMRVREKEQ